MGEEPKHAITRVPRRLCSQEVLLRDGPDGDDIGVHVDATVPPDDGQAGCVRADVEPVSLRTGVDLQDREQISQSSKGRGRVSQREASPAWLRRRKQASFSKIYWTAQFCKFTNLPPPKNFPSSEKFTAISNNGKILAAFKDFVNLFFKKIEAVEW